MTATDGPATPAPRVSLHRLALRHSTAPDAGPRAELRFPRYPGTDGTRPPHPDRRAAVLAALGTALSRPDPDPAARELDERLAGLGLHGTPFALRARERPEAPAAAVRALARRLIRTATTAAGAAIGIQLLRGHAGRRDAPALRLLAGYGRLTSHVLRTLEAVDPRAAAALHLARYEREDRLLELAALLDAGDDDGVGRWLAGTFGTRRPPPGTARRIADGVRLHELLGAGAPPGPLLVARATELLALMSAPDDSAAALLDYGPAVPVWAAVVAHAGLVAAHPAHRAELTTLAQEMANGPAVLLDWAPGQREELLRRLLAVLDDTPRAEPGPAAPAPAVPAPDRGGPREVWSARTLARLGRNPDRPPAQAPAGRSVLRIDVARHDPARSSVVEARLLVDGRPVVPALFGGGPAGSPEDLLDSGALRPGAGAREVVLAEAYCTEGCCGALRVTVRREGGDVVWDGWRGAGGGDREPVPPVRFGAAAYLAELDRAGSDRSWSWPARETARLLNAALRADPGILGRWGLRGSACTGFRDQDTAELYLTYEPGTGGGPAPWLQFRLRVPEDGTPPAGRAAAVLRLLAAEDPKRVAEVCGGSREYARELGYPWPDRERR